ncbi:MAG: glycine betaine ABC transporter substrate-binding protein [Corynebacterium sp.]|uniref:glycine betaine ABC transporter substrate-binding protein n=1 Tax=Corynebacterium TaxID=1716 RepID=UPI0026496889|nr:glycine betaine ABC transporter substrate-binding protein [Corynebacterium sp.]MDN5723383.1 glycine betaine ABC transporter substrate-binding protein [Corynebacterium sp.]MDN6281555.1 glycine betaine ABC transporter substrate-binding protein [Corynebacterium sp.]MDN6305152.1 glycine betaine ABC transporter substrate-binding protein [Corynebacterium sp.]MDN6353187.1 glycine betaine ABC transporter substrate-binding protein [Corynebacterium sp.]MDN6367385.1 glycine betaine ABC transporter sub
MTTTARQTIARSSGLRRTAGLGALLVTTALVATACGAENEGGGGGDDNTGSDVSAYEDCTPGEDSADLADLDTDDDKEISVAAFNGWDESFAASHLLKHVLEEDGYTVDITGYDAAPAYTGVAQGDIDLFMDGWLPITHDNYIEQYGDDMEAQGCWYDNAVLTLAVNEDSPAQEIGDLATMGDEYDNTLVGIDPGAGLTSQTQDHAIPEYELDNLDFQISSTPAMLAALKRATDSGDNIAVTLWRPHWAYDAFPVRDLEDPKGAMGEEEIIYNFSRSGFSDDNPYVSQLLKNLVINDENLSSLENVMFSEDNYGGENLDDAVAEWVEDNPEFVEDWRAGQLGE